MSRMQAVMPVNRSVLSVDDLHSLDALIEALRILKQEFEEDLGIRSSNEVGISQNKQKPFDVYKLFHKYRYCFYKDGVNFVTPQTQFRKRLRPTPGVGTIALNLYHNAVKYLAEYPGEHKIETYFKETAQGVDITISSMGPIVMPEELIHLGEKGFRTKAAREKHRGNGKGLARVIGVCKNSGFGYKFDSKCVSGCDKSFARFSATISIPSEKFLH